MYELQTPCKRDEREVSPQIDGVPRAELFLLRPGRVPASAALPLSGINNPSCISLRAKSGL
jgi:hypothetical protein